MKEIKRGDLVFVRSGEGFYGGRVLRVNNNSYRVIQTYGFPRVAETVEKDCVSLQDGQ